MLDHDLVAWEWIAPTGTALVGVVGIAAAVYGGNRQTATALAVARQQVDGQVMIAREERLQRRIETAYAELLVVLIQCEDYVTQVSGATFGGGTPSDIRAPAVFRDRIGAEGSMSAYWSPRTRQLIDEMRDGLLELYITRSPCMTWTSTRRPRRLAFPMNKPPA